MKKRDLRRTVGDEILETVCNVEAPPLTDSRRAPRTVFLTKISTRSIARNPSLRSHTTKATNSTKNYETTEDLKKRKVLENLPAQALSRRQDRSKPWCFLPIVKQEAAIFKSLDRGWQFGGLHGRPEM
jgi:hypothetical protein